MGYIQDNLLPDERIIYTTKLHWIIFIAPLICFLISFLLFSSGSDLAGVGTTFLIIAVVYALLRYLTYITSEFGLTNKRVVIKVGVIRRKTLELLLQKVETLGVTQGIIGRILNYGTIIVVGSGGTREPFNKIAAPLIFRGNVLSEIGKSM